GSSAFPPRAPDRDPARRTVGHLGPPFVQNARLRAGIEKETEGATLISTRHGPPAIPIAPLQPPAIPIAPLQGRAFCGPSHLGRSLHYLWRPHQARWPGVVSASARRRP